MSVNNISSVLAASTSASDRRAIDKNDFLTLLVTQLRNQDPLSPLQPHEFAAQLAQFTSVEQLTQLNEGMARQEDSLAMATLLSKTSFSAGLLGRQIVAAGDQVTIPAGSAGRVRIEVGGTGGHAELKLTDSTGREVATRDLGSLPPGRQTLTLPADLPAGSYHYSITVTGAGDKKVNVTTYTTGTVDGISFQDGRIVLKLGAIDIDLDDLAEIEPASGAPAAAGAALPGITKGGEGTPLPKKPSDPIVDALRFRSAVGFPF